MADAHIVAVVFLHRGNEALVGFVRAVERIRIGVDQSGRTFVVRTDDRVIGNGRAADERLLHAQPARLLGEFQRIRARKNLADHVTFRNLRDIRRVICGIEW